MFVAKGPLAKGGVSGVGVSVSGGLQLTVLPSAAPSTECPDSLSTNHSSFLPCLFQVTTSYLGPTFCEVFARRPLLHDLANEVKDLA